jgi:hypothetical protein
MLSNACRIQISHAWNTSANFVLIYLIDGTHVKIDIKARDNKDTIPKYEYKSTKDNTKNKYCFNFVMIILPNGFIADVLYPVPSKRSNSQSVWVSQNLRTNINYQHINKKFSPNDTDVKNCNFSPFFNRNNGKCIHWLVFAVSLLRGDKRNSKWLIKSKYFFYFQNSFYCWFVRIINFKSFCLIKLL